MAISIDEFKKALRETVSSDFSHIPCNEESIDLTFSEDFNKRMKKLIRAQGKSYYPFINTAAKRAAVILVAILSIFAASMSVKAIREPIVNFFIEIFECFSRITFDGETDNRITHSYEITKLPEGYNKIETIDNSNTKIVTYQNSSGSKLKFIQSSTDGINIDFDNEKTASKIKSIDETQIYIFFFNNTKHLKWIKNENYLEIISFGDLSVETLIEIAESIE